MVRGACKEPSTPSSMQAEVLVNHAAELVAPYLLWAPWPLLANAGAGVVLLYMGAIAASGSYATIQLITVAPVVASVRLPLWGRRTNGRSKVKVDGPELEPNARGQSGDAPRKAAPPPQPPPPALPLWRRAFDVAFCILIAWKSIEPIRESLSPSPWLHTYDSFLTVNSYGVFGFVNSRRYALGLAVTASALLPNGTSVPLVEGRSLGLPCLPGDPARPPCFHAFPPGFHRLLDWDVWIRTTASLEHAVDSGQLRLQPGSPPQRGVRLMPPSLLHALDALLKGDDGVARGLFEQPSARVALLGREAEAKAAVLAAAAAAGGGVSSLSVTVRSTLYHYEFANLTDPWGAEGRGGGRWWRRHRLRSVEPEVFKGRLPLPGPTPPVEDVLAALQQWIDARQPTVLFWSAAVLGATWSKPRAWLLLAPLVGFCATQAAFLLPSAASGNSTKPL
jgi:hypothetical protein